MKLYEISNAYAALLEAVDPETGELPEEALSALSEMDGELNEKAENTACAIKNMVAESDAIKAEIESLKARRESLENRVKALKQYLSDCLSAVGMKKIESARASVSLRHSSSIQVADLDIVPEVYKREKVTIEADKAAIKKALDAGMEVPGAVKASTDYIIVK